MTRELLRQKQAGTRGSQPDPNPILRWFPVFLVCLACQSAVGFMDNYLPLSEKEIRNSFPMRYEGELVYGQSKRVAGAGSSEILVSTNHNGDLLLSGCDKAQKPWKACIPGRNPEGSYKVFISDLDGDGTADLILVSQTGGCGLAPPVQVRFLLFDTSGRPAPFTVEGYFEYDSQGIRDMLKSGEDGRANLVYMSYDDGYWITNLYEARGGRWLRLQGQVRGRDYPIYTRFTKRDNHVPVRPASNRHPLAPDLSNIAATVRGQLSDYREASSGESRDITLEIQSDDGKMRACTPSSWYSTLNIVRDQPNLREIVSLDANERSVTNLLNSIAANHDLVSLFGQRYPNDISPELIWATPRPRRSEKNRSTLH